MRAYKGFKPNQDDGQLIEPGVYYTLRNGRVVCADGQV